MTIADQITRLNNAKAAIKQSIENKGVEVSDSALLDEYPALIDSIESGGGEGGGDSYYEDLFNARINDGENYAYLFYHSNAATLDVGRLDTSNATDMNNMFYNCTKLTQLDVSNFNTSNVTDMGSMFSNCQSLTQLDVSNFNTSNVTDMRYMFSNCQSLTQLDVSNFNTSNVTTMRNMFSNCTNLEEVNLSNFDMTNVTSMNTILGYNSKLHTIRLDNCSNDTINKIITSSSFPTDAIEGVTRKIYCKQDNAAGLTAPTNWVFEFIE